jgi:D-alanine transaminase
MPIAYYNGRFLPPDQIQISPNDRGWLLGDGVYEVAPAYHGAFLRLDLHLERLASSLAKMAIQGVDLDQIGEVAGELLRRNGLAEAPRALVHFQISRGSAPRTHAFPIPPVPPTVYGFAAPFTRKPGCDAGAAIITRSDFRWARCDIKAISLAANCLANQEAQAAGVYETVFVRDGMVLEGSHTNFFVVEQGVVRTAPLSNYILGGITRAIALDLCRETGILVREEALPETGLATVDEAFLTGSTTEIMPVVSVNGRPVGTGVPGPITRRLGERYLEANPFQGLPMRRNVRSRSLLSLLLVGLIAAAATGCKKKYTTESNLTAPPAATSAARNS